MTLKELHKAIPDWVLITATIVVAAFFLLIAAYFILQSSYNGRIYPGVSVAGKNIGGLSYEDARQVIERDIAELESGIPVRYKDREVLIAPEIASFDPDLSVPAIAFSGDKTFEQAAAIGRDNTALNDIYEQIAARLGQYQLSLAVTIDENRLLEQLTKSFADLEKPAIDASVTVTSDGKYTVSDEVAGVTFDYETAVKELSRRYQAADRSTVTLTDRLATPTIGRAEVRNIQSDIDRMLALPPAIVTFEKATWKLDTKTIAPWIGLERQEGSIVLVLKRDKITEFLTTKVVPAVNREPVEAKLSIENGRVSVWQAGRDGRALDLESAVKAITNWSQGGSKDIALAVTVVANTVMDQSAEELGLKEIIGTGVSHFAGSPANRRHNIRTGANSLNGVLLKPGEEFSLLKVLGDIDGRNGYLPELVIKGNKTIPEYGGGLCQVGTTIFRATFNSGLPVTQRRNHSYRVSYYEPAGTDATIYDPAPDYRFVNDTGHHILIQTRMEGNDLYFDLWGTKDGRKVVATKPVIYNIVKPAPTKIIETPDLPEGKRKCTESAHAGADAYFDYTVTYPNGEVKKERFSSHYIPWQAVCLVGAKKAAPTPATPTGTATPSVTPAPASTPTPTATPNTESAL